MPQGSVLGPLLFLVFINDIASVVNSNIKLYADDTTIFVSVDNPQVAADVLNNDLASIKSWADTWLVTFSPPKTESMTVTLRNRSQSHPNLYLDNLPIVDVPCHKHLGITISNNLDWHFQVHDVCSKAGERLDIMSRLMYKLDRKTLETMYFSYVRPKLEYSDIVWSNLTETQVHQIELVQKRAGRIVSGAIKGTSTSVIYHELGWSSLESRREQHIVLFMHKVIHGNIPGYLQDVIPETVQDRTNYNLRNNDHVTQFRTRLTLFYNSIFPRGVRCWNLLDPSLKNIDNHLEFKSEYLRGSPKPNQLYYHGDRKTALVLSRIRMCSTLRAHLFDNKVIPDSACQCGHDKGDGIRYFSYAHYTRTIDKFCSRVY